MKHRSSSLQPVKSSNVTCCSQPPLLYARTARENTLLDIWPPTSKRRPSGGTSAAADGSCSAMMETHSTASACSPRIACLLPVHTCSARHEIGRQACLCLHSGNAKSGGFQAGDLRETILHHEHQLTWHDAVHGVWQGDQAAALANLRLLPWQTVHMIYFQLPTATCTPSNTCMTLLLCFDWPDSQS
jgi:hypothetical protein